MAFSFANVASGLGSASESGVQVQDGPELHEIQTDQLGFTGVNGEARIRLLPEAWPENNLPIPSASLLSVASSQGLVAAAGPNELVIATTDDVRKALQATASENTRDITPMINITHSRLAHVAFSADESVLVVSGQESGGLIAYQVDKLKINDTQPALEIATNGKGLRAISANPAIQYAHLYACITLDGELLLADLSKGSLVEGPEGVVLAKNASSLSWSSKGKQLVVGLSDGTATQIKPDGTIAAHLPKSRAIAEDMHISGISWLENDIFFVIYTPNSVELDQGIPPSEYFIITREKKQYSFQKLPEILPPFGLERVPTFHFISRLRDWKPHITDLLLLSSTSATEIGMISKASQGLSSGEPITNAFTYTVSDDDTRRAALPLSGASDTSPIGMSLDLSAKTGVVNPISADPEIEETAGPVPNIMMLNNEGILCSWWIIYNDSVRQKTTFSGFTSLDSMDEARAAASPKPSTVAPMQSIPPVSSELQSIQIAGPRSGFGQPNTSSSSPWAGSSNTFGTGSSFGSASKIGGEKSSWTSTGFSTTTTTASTSGSAFGQPAFGQTGFGTKSNAQITGSASSAQPTAPSAPAFGQTGFGAKTTLASPFAASGASAGQSGFSSFAGSGGFASKSSGFDTKTSSPFGQASQGAFGQKPTVSGMISQSTGSSVFGQPASSNAFTKSTPFGSASIVSAASKSTATAPFKLESSFKGDGTAKDDLPPLTSSQGFGFNKSLDDLLQNTSAGQLSPTHDREEEMEDDANDASGSEATATDRPVVTSSDSHSQKTEVGKAAITPPSTFPQPKITPAQPVTSIFGSLQQNNKTPQTSFGAPSWSFADATSTTPKETPGQTKSIFGQPLQQPGKSFSKNASSLPQTLPKEIKTESASDEDTVNISNIPEAPLPPDPLSRPEFQAGDTSLSSINSSKPDDAPLPPDFLPSKKSGLSKEVETALPGDSDDDDDDEGFTSDFEESGEDLTHDISPADEGDDEDEDEDGDDAEHEDDDDDGATEHLQTSPESSFKGEDTTHTVASPTGGLFTKISSTQPTNSSRPLFGEIGASAPTFPPPKPQESPRSPSPVRRLHPHDTLRSDSRSVSAPLQARSAIDQRKFDYLQSNNAAKAAQARQEEIARERARLDAISKAQAQARTSELQSLEDDEDRRIQDELSQPIQPNEHLDAFITYEPVARTESIKVDIPAQIERLYQDINSMIYTLGINARSLQSFLAYQKSRRQNRSWPAVLQSDTPLDALDDERFLQDIESLREGSSALGHVLEARAVQDVAQKLETCQGLLSGDLTELRSRITAVKRSIYARRSGDDATTSLSAEQTAVQHDLRAVASSVQTNLIAVEDGLSLLRARISDLQPADIVSRRDSRSVNSPKKPTVEAVTSTIAKMTSMAEKRSADVDVLEGQLRRLGINGQSRQAKDASPRPSTPQHHKTTQIGTPGSGASSIFYTPDSRTAASVRSTRSLGGVNGIHGLNMVSLEDKIRWQATARRKKDVASALRSALVQRRTSSVAQ